MTPKTARLVNNTLKTRIQSMYDLRTRVEDLASMLGAEEEGFRESIGMLVEQNCSQTERMQNLEEQVGAYETMLQSEEQEKSKAVEMVAAFKKEGEAIMKKLKEALREVTVKYESERGKREKLESDVQDKLESYRQLLEQQEKVVVQLQERNQQLELKSKNAVKLVNDIKSADGFNQDYHEIMSELKILDKATTPTSSRGTPLTATPTGTAFDELGNIQHKLRLKDQIIQMLYAKLKSEQTHRLETEEQAALMVAAEEETIRKLEERLRDVEGERDSIMERTRLSLASNTIPSSTATPISVSPVVKKVCFSFICFRNLNKSKSNLKKQQLDVSHDMVLHDMPAAPSATLEIQLAEVTKDFNQSLEMWSDRINETVTTVTATTPLTAPFTSSYRSVPAGHQDSNLVLRDLEDDFQPDTPSPQRLPSMDADFLPDTPG